MLDEAYPSGLSAQDARGRGPNELWWKIMGKCPKAKNTRVNVQSSLRDSLRFALGRFLHELFGVRNCVNTALWQHVLHLLHSIFGCTWACLQIQVAHSYLCLRQLVSKPRSVFEGSLLSGRNTRRPQAEHVSFYELAANVSEQEGGSGQ